MSNFRDLVLQLPGITGSVLADARGKEVWSPSAGAIWRAISTLGGSVRDLALEPSGDPGGVTATRLVPDTTIVPPEARHAGHRAGLAQDRTRPRPGHMARAHRGAGRVAGDRSGAGGRAASLGVAAAARRRQPAVS